MVRKGVILYEYIQEKMEKYADVEQLIISNNKAREILARQFHVPSWLQAPVLNEMVKMNLLSRLDKFRLSINIKEKEILT